MGQLSTVDRAFRRLKPRARSADRFSATVERRGASRPYLPRDVVDGQVEVGAEHLEGEALGLASAAFLRGRGRMMSVPALESGRVALAEDVARDAARGRRTAGNISREGRGFLAAFPKKRTGWTRRARAETTGASAIRGARARRSPHANAKSPETALVHPSRSPRHPRCRARTLGIFSKLVRVFGTRPESISPSGFVPVIQARRTGACARDRVGTSAERPRVRSRFALEGADREARVLARA